MRWRRAAAADPRAGRSACRWAVRGLQPRLLEARDTPSPAALALRDRLHGSRTRASTLDVRAGRARRAALRAASAEGSSSRSAAPPSRRSRDPGGELVGQVLRASRVAQQQPRSSHSNPSTGRETSQTTKSAMRLDRTEEVRQAPVAGRPQEERETLSESSAENKSSERRLSPLRSCASSCPIIATRSPGASAASSGSPSSSTRRRLSPTTDQLASSSRTRPRRPGRPVELRGDPPDEPEQRRRHLDDLALGHLHPRGSHDHADAQPQRADHHQDRVGEAEHDRGRPTEHQRGGRRGAPCRDRVRRELGRRHPRRQLAASSTRAPSAAGAAPEPLGEPVELGLDGLREGRGSQVPGAALAPVGVARERSARPRCTPGRSARAPCSAR